MADGAQWSDITQAALSASAAVIALRDLMERVHKAGLTQQYAPYSGVLSRQEMAALNGLFGACDDLQTMVCGYRYGHSG